MNLSCQGEPAYGLVTAGQDSETYNRIPHQRQESGRSFTVAQKVVRVAGGVSSSVPEIAFSL